jgi:hypothetical protein
MKNLLIVLGFLFLVSCSNIPHGDKSAKLFPYGTYHHNISINLKGKEMNFPGINLWSAERFVVIGLGPMDITMIKYEEDRVNYKNNLFINKEMIPLDESKALQMISLLKDMYSWDKSICSGNECKKTYFGVPIIFDLNEKGEVSKFHAERQGVKVNVDVTSYEKIL